MADEDEVEFTIHTSEDGCTVTVTIAAKHELTYQDLLENLDFCYRELKRAFDQKTKPGVLEH